MRLAAPTRWTVFLGLVIAPTLACGGGPDGPTPPERPEPLPPLPPPVSEISGRFADSIRCSQCHLAADDDPEALRDAAGRDVSPVKLWRSSMMALAARDPFYLAAWNEERSRYPQAAAEIDATCARCHAPMAAVATENGLTFEALVSGDSPEARLGRDGVSCALCHQIRPDNLGRDASLSGGFEIGFSRTIFGPHPAPDTGPMEFFLQFTPVQSDHILDSELCATCHTVIVEPLDDKGVRRGFELTEQATYFEWLNSSYADAQSELALPCAGCHLPTTDQDEAPISAPIATNPATLGPRAPFGRHLFVGGGAYMTRLLSANRAWAGLEIDDAELAATASASETHLATAATLAITSSSQTGGVATVTVRVENKTGHKLPTGYPSRRMWLHLIARDGSGQIVFESGAASADGSLADDGGGVRPHRDRITTAGDVVVWEAVLIDDDGDPTHRPLGAVAYGKDTRILPAGFQRFHPEIDRMRPIGADDDSNFVAGSDSVTFEFAASDALAIEVELLYQSLPPSIAAAHEAWPTPAGVRFAEMVVARPPTPIAIASATAAVP